MVPKGCQFTIPLGSNGHPFEGAGIYIYFIYFHHFEPAILVELSEDK